MRKFIFLILLTLTFTSYGQKGMYRPFKMVIISVDTVTIDKALFSFIDTIQQDHLNGYYASLKQLEEIANDTTVYPKELMTEKESKETKLQTKAELDTLKKYEYKIKQFKYYQTISEYSTQVYQFYFNEYPPLSTFQLIDKSKISLKNLSHIADSLKAEYVLGFKNIHTENNNGRLTIKLTTILYSKKDNKILLEKETTGNENSYGDMWTCMNPLSCLLITAVKSSTANVADILRRRQHR